MLINKSGCGYAKWVADEQNSNKPITFWDPYSKDICPDDAELTVDLGQVIPLKNIYIFSSNKAEIKFSNFLHPKMTEGKVYSLKTGWNQLAVNSKAKYVCIYFVEKAKIGEILIETDKKYSRPVLQKTERENVLMQDFIGTNAFVDVPIALLSPFGCIREYHDWPDWNEPQKDSILLNITKNGFNFELFYSNLNRQQQCVLPVIQKSPSWLTGSDNQQFIPVEKGANNEQPASYSRHALFMNRYASNFSGQNTNVVYYENWNEPDKWWEQKGSYFGPYQYAAMSSADKESIGAGLNGKNGKLVMAGIANPKLDYLHALKYWCDVNRSGQFAWDVINFHQYSNSVTLPDDFPKAAICPEKGKVYETANSIVNFRNRYLPNTEVWVSEFGFDTEKSPQQCLPIAEKNSELVQADWLIRSYLLYSAAGVEKAFQFMIRDSGKDGLYATSGIYSNTQKQKAYLKPAWNYIKTMKSILQDSYFKSIALDTLNNFYTIEYVSKRDSELKTWVLWLGTDEGKEMDYKPKYLKKEKARQISFSASNACGTAASISENVVISETPIFIQEHPRGNFPVCKELMPLDAKMISSNDENGNPLSALFDEQDGNKQVGFGIYGANPTSFLKPSYQTQKSEYYFNFSSAQYLHSISVFDGAGAGEISFYEQKDNSWSYINKLDMNSYNQWKSLSLNICTKKIKAVISKGKPDIGEIVFYVNN